MLLGFLTFEGVQAVIKNKPIVKIIAVATIMVIKEIFFIFSPELSANPKYLHLYIKLIISFRINKINIIKIKLLLINNFYNLEIFSKTFCKKLSFCLCDSIGFIIAIYLNIRYNLFMLKLFWDKDNIAFVSNHVNATEHSHCVLQIFLSFDEPLQVAVVGESISGKCIIVNQNVCHRFSCNNKMQLSVLVEPSSNFAKELIKKIDGNYLIYNKIECIQQKAYAIINTNDKEKYLDFVSEFANYLGVKRGANILDERINKVLEKLQKCDCYNHTIENLAKEACLSPSRLSHLFAEQIGVPLKSYVQFHQLERAFTAILKGKSITDSAMLAGFNSPSHFAATVKKWMGMSVSTSIKNSEFLKVFI